jgi:hypothetical protein
MTHRRLVLEFVTLCLVAVLLPGCVPVREPLSDAGKAEQDKGLLGKWKLTSCSANWWLDDKDQRYEIDCQAVKRNPKGLMRAMYEGRADDPDNTFWFFTTTIGKHTYATIYRNERGFADFRKEGAFEKWNEEPLQRYYVFRYVLDGDKLTVDGGDSEAMKKLMHDERISEAPYFDTPRGWLAKYLEKSGPKTLYNGTNVQEWRRQKK